MKEIRLTDFPIWWWTAVGGFQSDRRIKSQLSTSSATAAGWSAHPERNPLPTPLFAQEKGRTRQVDRYARRRRLETTDTHWLCK